jgi:hypothetical protein
MLGLIVLKRYIAPGLGMSPSSTNAKALEDESNMLSVAIGIDILSSRVLCNPVLLNYTHHRTQIPLQANLTLNSLKNILLIVSIIVVVPFATVLATILHALGDDIVKRVLKFKEHVSLPLRNIGRV